MKDQNPTFGLVQKAVILGTHNLTRGDEQHRAFLVVVNAAAIFQAPALRVLQQHRIDVVQLAAEAQRLRFAAVNDADQRMKGLDPEIVIVLLDGIHPHYLTHNKRS